MQTNNASLSGSRRMCRLVVCVLALSVWTPLPPVTAQSNYDNYGYENDPNDYGGPGGAPDQGGPDNLYHDYAARQQEKEIGGAGIGNAGGAMGWTRVMAGGALGWFLGGKYHSSRLAKKLQAKHKQDQKVLYQQYYNDVYTLQQQNSELVMALEKQYGATSGTKTTGARRKA